MSSVATPDLQQWLGGMMRDVEVMRPGSDIAVIALHGEHDAVTKQQLEDLLAAEIQRNALVVVVVDVTDAAFVDSSVLHNLVTAHRLARARGSRMILQMGTARIVRSAIEISGILDSLDWVQTRAEALAAASQTRRNTIDD